MIIILFTCVFSLSGIVYSQRIINQDVGEIISCSFCYLYWSKNGAAICINSLTNVSLLIKDSCFRSCVSTNLGGSIFFTSISLSVKSCCWEVCYIHNGIDNEYGNVMYSSTPSLGANLTASLACGPYREISGDSTFHLKTSNLSVHGMNNSNCNTFGGSTGLQADGLTNTDNCAKFLNVINGSSNHVITVYPNPMRLTIYTSNFIGVNTSRGHFDSQFENLYIYRCYIYKVSNSKLIEGSVYFSNCTGNFQHNGISNNNEKIIIKSIIAELCGIGGTVYEFKSRIRLEVIVYFCFLKNH